ncbi:MAG: phosphatidylglycerophosphatase A [Vicinamibacteria bacterium]|jgi:phosphatidylglycerophosphatase A|nr:phosphatidylglycerophosphatase A [Vicinamibacteria bacterium]
MSVKERLAFVLATGFGSGYSPFAPGTAGSAVGLLFVWGMSYLSLPWQLAAVLVVTVLSMIAADIVARSTGLKDPGLIVADEIAGMMVTMIAIPLSATSLILGFILFRVMDVVKPPPARQFENFKGGIGIVADDLMAGVYAHLALRGILMLIG